MDTNHILKLIKKLHILLEQYHRDTWTLTPSQSIVMGYLLEQSENTFCSTDLHVQVGVSKSSISRMLKTLKHQGYLEMPNCPNDDRKKKIILTEKALAEKNHIEEYLCQLQNCLCSGISENNLIILEDCLQKMICNLKCEHGKEQTIC